RALAERRKTFLQLGKVSVITEPGEAATVALQIAESEVVDDADESVEFQERVLERRRREQDLWKGSDGLFDRDRDLARVLVDVAEAVRLVDDHEVPSGLPKIGFLGPRELIRAEDDRALLEGVQIPSPNGIVEAVAFEDDGGQIELVLEFLAPLLAQVGGEDDEEATLSLRPFL